MSRIHSSSRPFVLAVLLMASALIASPMHAQDAEAGSESDASPEESVVVRGAPLFPVGSVPTPDLRTSPSELLWSVDGTPLELVQDRGLNRGTDVALMVVGGTAIVVGLLLGGEAGTIIAVSGGVIGLIGLYRFVR